MADVRTGFGYDAHRFGGEGPVVLAGVSIEHPVGVIGTSDADVATHAICDALLGAVAAGDLGSFFPSSEQRWEGVDSLLLLASSADVVAEAGYTIGSIDLKNGMNSGTNSRLARMLGRDKYFVVMT